MDRIGLWLLLLAPTACGLDASPIRPTEQATTASPERAAQTSDAPQSMASCPGSEGLYCGGHGFNADEHSVYRCAAGVFSLVSVCADGCERVAAGGDDHCKRVEDQAGAPAAMGAQTAGSSAVSVSGAAPTPPGAGTVAQAGSAAPSGGGAGAASGGAGAADAGASAAIGGAGGHRWGGFAGRASAAGGGGNTAHAGAGGHGGGAAQPTRCPNGDGNYCGLHGIGGDRNTLYACDEGKLEDATRCPFGCQAVGNGAHDHCQQPPTQGPGGPPGPGGPGPGNPGPQN